MMLVIETQVYENYAWDEDGSLGTGANAYEVDYTGGRNGGRGPGYTSLDVRAGYVIRMAGGRTLNLFVDAFNATNEANFANPPTDLRAAATFLNLTTLTNGVARTFQLNARLGF